MAVLTYRVALGADTEDPDFGGLSLADVTAANRTDGWTSAKIAAGLSSDFDAGTKKASGTFSSQTTTAKPPATMVITSAAGAFVTPISLKGNFAATAWTFTFALRCTVASSQRGRMLMRVYRGPNADGSGATQITSTPLVGTTVAAALSTTADQTSVITWSPGALSFNYEYLFFVLAWEITTAGGSNSADVVIRTGQAAAGSRFVTADFTDTTVPDNETLIDDFNRADGNVNVGAGAALWEAFSITGSGSSPPVLSTIGNALSLPASGASSIGAVAKQSLEKDFDLVIDCTTAPTSIASPFSFHICASEVGTSTWDGYRVEILDATSWRIQRVVDGAVTTLATVAHQIPAAGDQLWVRKRGTNIRFYRKPSGGSWILVVQTTDATYDRIGRFGVHLATDRGQKYDNLRGGPIYVPPPPPNPPLLDDFNRPDAYPISGEWGGSWGGDGWQIVNNEIVNLKGAGLWDGIAYNQLPLNADAEVVVDVTGVAPNTYSFQMWLRRDGGADEGYLLNLRAETLPLISIWKRDATVDTQLGADLVIPSLTVGDKIGFQISGSTLRAWWWSGGGWAFVGERTDSTFSLLGVAALYSNHPGWKLDNFSGSPFPSVGPSISAADSVALSDSLSLVQGSVISLADATTSSDALSLVADQVAGFADSVTTSDSLAFVQDYVLAVEGATYTAQVLADVPISYWRLGSETMAHDEMGVSPDVAPTGGWVNAGLLTGDSDTSILFDGGDDYIVFPNAAAHSVDVGTLEIWMQSIELNVGGSFRALLVKSNAYGIFMYDNELVIYDWGGAAIRYTGVFLNDNVRHHIAVTFQSGIAGGTQIYLDGVAVGPPTTLTVSGQETGLAIAQNSNTQLFRGILDEAAIYGTVLSPSRIAAHYQAGIGAGGGGDSVVISDNAVLDLVVTHDLTASDTVTLSDNAPSINFQIRTSLQGLQDTFDSTVDKAVKWGGTTAGVVWEAGQAKIPVELFQNLGTNPYGLRYDLTGSYMFAQVTPPGFAGNRSFNFDLVSDSDGLYRYGFEIYSSAGNRYLRATRMGNSIITVVGSSTEPHHATNHAFLRIRESAGTIYWDTSPDGNTWTNFRSEGVVMSVTSVAVLFSGWHTGGAGGIAYVDNVNVGLSLPLDAADSVVLSDSPAWIQDYVFNLADTATATDDASAISLAQVLDVADSVTATDTPDVSLGVVGNFADTVTLSDLLDLQVVIPIDLADSVVLSDSLATVQDIVFGVADAVTVTDSPLLESVILLDAADTVTISDAPSFVESYVENFADTVTLSDLLDLQFVIPLGLADTVTVSDVASLSFDVGVAAADSVALSDLLTAFETGLGIDASDGVTLSDSAILAKPDDRPQFSRAFSFAFELSAGYAGAISHERGGGGRTTAIAKSGGAISTESAGAAKFVTVEHTITVADAVTTSDSPAFTYFFTLSETDAVTATDVAALDLSYQLNFTDAVTTSDDLVADVARLEIITADIVTTDDAFSFVLYMESLFEDTVVLTDELSFTAEIPQAGGASEGANAGVAKSAQIVKAGGAVEPQIARGFQTYAVAIALGAVEGQSGGGTGLKTALVDVQTGASSTEVAGGTAIRTQLVVKAGGAVEGTESGISVLKRVSKSVGAISAESGSFIVGLAEVGGSYSAESGGISKVVTAVKQIQGTEGSVGGGAAQKLILQTKTGGATEGSVAGGAKVFSRLVILSVGAVEEQQAGAARAMLVSQTGGGISSERSQGTLSLLYLFAKQGGGYEIQSGGLKKLSTRTLVVGGTVVEIGGAKYLSLRVRTGGAVSGEIGGLYRQQIIAKRLGGIAPERAGGYSRRIKTFIEVYGISEEKGGGKLDYLIAIPPGDGTEGELIGSEFGASLISASSKGSGGQLVGATTGAMVLSGIEKAILVAAQEEVDFE